MAVLVPPGKYKLTRTVEITSSNVVLRGAGVSAKIGSRPLLTGAWDVPRVAREACGKATVQPALHESSRTRGGLDSKGDEITVKRLGLPCPPLQSLRTTLYFPKPLAAIYGNKEEWAMGGTFLT